MLITRIVVALMVLPWMVANVAPAEAANSCGATAKAARQACRNGANDDFWTSTGTCLNLSTKDAVKTCTATAKQTLADAKAECAAQFAARVSLCDQVGKGPYDPVIDPAAFLTPAQIAANPNPFFPLVPGDLWVYKNASNGETDTVTVTDQTRVIDGVTTIVVHDVVMDAGNTITEDTLDHFAQQTDGTVWYFGESTEQFENGLLVGIEGTFYAGRDGAKPGIIMEAAPAVGDVYRQEFLLGEAEDAAQVVSTTASESVPGASCNGTCLETLEFSPLDVGGDEHKFYAPGIGVILEVDVDGGARNELISFTHP